jgi:tight adherence protein B
VSRTGGDVAAVLDRVAALVGAGIPPTRAWTIAEGDRGAAGGAAGGAGGRGAVASARRGGGAGGGVGGGAVWADVRAVVAVAERTGAPITPALRALARAVRETTESDRAIRVALAGPRASARVVLALPVLGLLLGSVWGAGAVRTLVATPIGWACCGAAAVLVVIAARWSGRLIRAAEPPGRVPGALLESWAVAVSGGGSWRSAGSAVRDAWPDQTGRDDEVRRIREAIALASSVGVPVAALLRAEAEDVRRDAAATGLAAAERLAVRLVLPLGVCVLPAFVLVGVVPVVVGVLSSTAGAVG